MKLFSIIMLIFFYVFFFIRNFILAYKLKTRIKENSIYVNISIIASGLSFIFIVLDYFISGKAVLFFHFLPQNLFLSIISIIFIFIGLLFSIISSLSLRNSWRVGLPSEKTELIKKGIYSISRNPYFTSFIIVFIGQVLGFPNFFVLFSSLAAVIFFHLMILKEEKYLENIHGKDYIEYKKNVPRYLFF